MKVNYEDYFDEYYDDDDVFRQSKVRKFRDSDKPTAGNGSNKNNIRKKRKQKQREKEAYQTKEEEY